MPDAATHPTPEELAAYGLGKLPDRASAAVAAHLEGCAACRRAVASLTPDSFVGKVRAARPAGGPDPPAAPGVPPELANHPRYRILRELGRGGMGVVYQARQTVMDRQVVIKVINKSLLEHPDALERFRREVRAAARLSHPNIVTAYDAEQAGDLHMLVMEFVPGQSLAEVLDKKGPLPVAQACDCVRQAALGLRHAFEQGMVHRDIKPQNLMLTPKGQVKVLDFGLAKVVSESGPRTHLTALGSYMGTPDYSAPEQATDARSADIRADLYSLGCTLYCLLAGRPPFREDTAVQTILAHLEKEPPPLPELRPDVPAALWAVVARLLAKDPAHRYQTPAEVAQALAPSCKPGGKAGPVPRGARNLPGAASPGGGTVAAGDTRRPKTLQGELLARAPAQAAPPAEATFAGLQDLSSPGRRAVPRPGGRGGRRRGAGPLLLAGAGGATVALLGIILIIKFTRPDGSSTELRLETREGPVAQGKALSPPTSPQKTAIEQPKPSNPAAPPKPPAPAAAPAEGPAPAADVKPPPPPPPAAPDRKGETAVRPAASVEAGARRVSRSSPGKWRIDGEELVQESLDASCQLVFGDPAWMDYDFTCEAKKVQGKAEIGIIYRATDAGHENLGLGGWDNTLDFATSVRRGRLRQRKHTTAGVQGERWYRISVKLRGAHCQCFRDDQLLFDYEDTTNAAGGVGCWTHLTAARFRNLRVTDPDGKVLFEGLPELPAPGPEPQPAAETDGVKAAVVRGVAYLKSQQQADGTWKHPTIGATALCGLTLVEGGGKPDDPAVLKAADAVRLASIDCTHTYSLALGILFLDRLGDPADAELIESMAVRLLAGQNPQSGGWSYNCPPLSAEEIKRLQAGLRKRRDAAARPAPGAVQVRKDFSHLAPEIQKQVTRVLTAPVGPAPAGDDNSNTQFAALALWVAGRQGVPIERASRRLEARFRGTQKADGAWAYTYSPPNPKAPNNGQAADSTPTMTCAGLLGLAVGVAGGPKRGQGAVRDPAVARALQLLGDKLAGAAHAADGSPGGTPAGKALYYLWDLERVCLVYDLKTVGDKDWYAWGVDWLLEHQKEDGSWRGDFGEGGPDTCFALLFLERSNLAADLTRQLK